jgi:hypothetical protein
VTISNCWVTGYYELGTVLDGTFKKFAPEDSRAAHRAALSAAPNRMAAFINITISNCVFEGCQGYALESEDGACWKTSPSPIPPCAIWSRGQSLCASVPVARPQREHQGGHHQAHPDQQSRMLQRPA